MWLWLSLALAQSPMDDAKSVSFQYMASFDLDAQADAYCKFTKLCDCQAVYSGTGKRVQDAEGLVFKGTFVQDSGECHEALTFWSPADKESHFTFRIADGKVVEWVAHADLDNGAPLKEKIKEGKQVWLTELDLQPELGKLASSVQRDTGDLGSGLTMASEHRFEATFK